jgi:hypothetical protein
MKEVLLPVDGRNPKINKKRKRRIGNNTSPIVTATWEENFPGLRS